MWVRFLLSLIFKVKKKFNKKKIKIIKKFSKLKYIYKYRAFDKFYKYYLFPYNYKLSNFLKLKKNKKIKKLFMCLAKNFKKTPLFNFNTNSNNHQLLLMSNITYFFKFFFSYQTLFSKIIFYNFSKFNVFLCAELTTTSKTFWYFLTLSFSNFFKGWIFWLNILFFFKNKIYLTKKIKKFFYFFLQKPVKKISYFFYINNNRHFLNKFFSKKINIYPKNVKKKFLMFNNFYIKGKKKMHMYILLKKINLISLNLWTKNLTLLNKKQYYSYLYYSNLYFFGANWLNNFCNKTNSAIYFLNEKTFLRQYLISLAKTSKHFDKYQYATSYLSKVSLFVRNKLIYYIQNYKFNTYPLKANFFFILKQQQKKNNFFLNFSVKTQQYFFNPVKFVCSFNANKKFNLNLTKFEFLIFFFIKPLFLKYFFLLNFYKTSSYFFLNKKFNYLSYFFNNLFFYSTTQKFFLNNLLPTNNFSYLFKKKIIKIFSYTNFFYDSTYWYYQTIIKFLEYCSGKKACFKIFPFLISALNFYEKLQCLLWAQRVKYYRKVLGPRLFLNESLQVIYLSLKLKDPYLFSNWMTTLMYKISFWKYKTFLRYVKYVLRYFFWVIFKELRIKGIKYQLKGKISVAGNARTRTAFHYVGFTSHSTFNNKILYNLNLVKTFTGVLGFKLWMVF